MTFECMWCHFTFDEPDEYVMWKRAVKHQEQVPFHRPILGWGRTTTPLSWRKAAQDQDDRRLPARPAGGNAEPSPRRHRRATTRCRVLGSVCHGEASEP
jgi:hypothetical protein